MVSFIEQIISNLYSYAVFIIIGFVIYLLYELATATIIKSFGAEFRFFILILLSILLPFCNCIAITFFLYDTKETKKILLYLIASFLKIPTILLINIYFGITICVIYILIIALLIVIYLVLCNVFKLSDTEEKDIPKIERCDAIKDQWNNMKKGIFNSGHLAIISRFSCIYIISIIIMSLVEFMIPNVLVLSAISNAESIGIIESLYISITRYMCLPSDLTMVSTLVASGLSIKLIAIFIIIGTLFNISELLTALVFIRKRVLLVLFMICAFGTTILYMVITTLIFNNTNFSFDYDLSKLDKYTKVINLLNINPNSFIRYFSIILIIILAVSFIILPFYNRDT